MSVPCAKMKKCRGHIKRCRDHIGHINQTSTIRVTDQIHAFFIHLDDPESSGFLLKSMNRDANYFRGMECAISGLDL